MIQGLQGYTVVRNAFDGDYAIKECVDSMLACCEKVLVCDSDSTDGTREFLDRMADAEPRLEVVNYPWPNPKGDAKFFTTWLNFARERLTLPFQLQLDADEILDDSPKCHARIREAVEKRQSLTCDRLNYWKSPKFLIPEGHCIGKKVVRVAPSEWWMPSDEGGYKMGDLPILDNAVDATGDVKIHHVGFLRDKDAFYRKARVVLAGFFNNYDQRLEATEANKQTVCEVPVEWADQLVPFSGHIPEAVQLWLASRGHDYDMFLPQSPMMREPEIKLGSEIKGDAVNVLHSGDFGDIIAGMAVMKQLGRVKIYVTDRGITKPIIERLDVIRPLLLAQEYVESVEIYNGETIHWNASDFRKNYSSAICLAASHLEHFKGVNLRPVDCDFRMSWMKAAPDHRWRGRVVINRSPRYHNMDFPWDKIVKHYGEKIVFIGLKHEHESFCRSFGTVEFVATKNMLECAGIIAGSSLFIGNQSACFNIAEAIKHPRILEACAYRPDCIYPPSELSQYILFGEIKLPAIGALKETVVYAQKAMEIPSGIETPPGGWQFNGLPKNIMHPSVAINMVRQQHPEWTKEEARTALFRHNMERVPHFFDRSHLDKSNARYRLAMKNAGYA